MSLKKIGYYIVKGRCVKAYAKKKRNRAGKLVTKKVNYRGKTIKKGTKIYKTKANCVKALRKKMKRGKSSRSNKRKHVRTRTHHTSRSRFGQKSCAYSVPYFGNMVPSISKTLSGTQNTGYSSSLWKWPNPPGALAYDTQQGGWLRTRNN